MFASDIINLLKKCYLLLIFFVLITQLYIWIFYRMPCVTCIAFTFFLPVYFFCLIVSLPVQWLLAVMGFWVPIRFCFNFKQDCRLPMATACGAASRWCFLKNYSHNFQDIYPFSRFSVEFAASGCTAILLKQPLSEEAVAMEKAFSHCATRVDSDMSFHPSCNFCRKTYPIGNKLGEKQVSTNVKH